MLYIKPFGIALVISVSIILILLLLEKKIIKKNSFLKNREGLRHIHNKNISRLGGVAIILSFIGTLLLDKNLTISNILWGIIFGSIVILAVGVWDDFKEIDWRIQLFFQICVVASLFVFGAKINYITNPFGGVFYFDTEIKMIISILFVMLWALVLINAMNWLDGIDGLSGGVSLIAVLTIFFLALKPEVNQPPVAIIAMALAGGLIGFLMFNFYPAKIMAGTSGSFFMGFILISLSIFAGTKIATTLLVMIIPIIDFFWVISRRIVKKKSIFKPDQEHLHYRLLKVGWSQRKITLFFYVITLAIAVLALNISTVDKLFLVAIAGIIALFAYKNDIIPNPK
ncbi:MAG TPA: undecaprenyl/decaprenyl-phosphate alpha-N-acetylglucosaminyl 1-phosphate transferase [Candidatus Moranbacteria bacterium]|nr:undecaprenyl/decaprenyl-phosphate alpha-N-acetylglucosaminyl 1-phosphate transferase [Candidatus Moranbacteria bacterium]